MLRPFMADRTLFLNSESVAHSVTVMVVPALSHFSQQQPLEIIHDL